MLINLNEELLQSVLDDAGDFILTPEHEEAIVELESAYRTINEAYKALQEKLKENAQIVDGNAQVFETDRLRITISESGAQYSLQDAQKCPPDVLKVTLDTDALKNYLKEHDGIAPDGVVEKQRSKAVRIKVKA